MAGIHTLTSFEESLTNYPPMQTVFREADRYIDSVMGQTKNLILQRKASAIKAAAIESISVHWGPRVKADVDAYVTQVIAEVWSEYPAITRECVDSLLEDVGGDGRSRRAPSPSPGPWSPINLQWSMEEGSSYSSGGSPPTPPPRSRSPSPTPGSSTESPRISPGMFATQNVDPRSRSPSPRPPLNQTFDAVAANANSSPGSQMIPPEMFATPPRGPPLNQTFDASPRAGNATYSPGSPMMLPGPMLNQTFDGSHRPLNATGSPMIPPGMFASPQGTPLNQTFDASPRTLNGTYSPGSPMMPHGPPLNQTFDGSLRMGAGNASYTSGGYPPPWEIAFGSNPPFSPEPPQSPEIPEDMYRLITRFDTPPRTPDRAPHPHEVAFDGSLQFSPPPYNPYMELMRGRYPATGEATAAAQCTAQTTQPRSPGADSLDVAFGNGSVYAPSSPGSPIIPRDMYATPPPRGPTPLNQTFDGSGGIQAAANANATFSPNVPPPRDMSPGKSPGYSPQACSGGSIQEGPGGSSPPWDITRRKGRQSPDTTATSDSSARSRRVPPPASEPNTPEMLKRFHALLENKNWPPPIPQSSLNNGGQCGGNSSPASSRPGTPSSNAVGGFMDTSPPQFNTTGSSGGYPSSSPKLQALQRPGTPSSPPPPPPQQQQRPRTPPQTASAAAAAAAAAPQSPDDDEILGSTDLAQAPYPVDPEPADYQPEVLLPDGTRVTSHFWEPSDMPVVRGSPPAGSRVMKPLRQVPDIYKALTVIPELEGLEWEPAPKQVWTPPSSPTTPGAMMSPVRLPPVTLPAVTLPPVSMPPVSMSSGQTPDGECLASMSPPASFNTTESSGSPGSQPPPSPQQRPGTPAPSQNYEECLAGTSPPGFLNSSGSTRSPGSPQPSPRTPPPQTQAGLVGMSPPGFFNSSGSTRSPGSPQPPRTSPPQAYAEFMETSPPGFFNNSGSSGGYPSPTSAAASPSPPPMATPPAYYEVPPATGRTIPRTPPTGTPAAAVGGGAPQTPPPQMVYYSQQAQGPVGPPPVDACGAVAPSSPLPQASLLPASYYDVPPPTTRTIPRTPPPPAPQLSPQWTPPHPRSLPPSVPTQGGSSGGVLPPPAQASNSPGGNYNAEGLSGISNPWAEGTSFFGSSPGSPGNQNLSMWTPGNSPVVSTGFNSTGGGGGATPPPGASTGGVGSPHPRIGMDSPMSTGFTPPPTGAPVGRTSGNSNLMGLDSPVSTGFSPPPGPGTASVPYGGGSPGSANLMGMDSPMSTGFSPPPGGACQPQQRTQNSPANSDLMGYNSSPEQQRQQQQQ